MRARLSKLIVGLCVLVFLLTGAFAQEPPIQVITSTTIIADVVSNVGGDLVEVSALVPPDADVHAFQPNPRDLVAVADADVVFVNGVGLEEFLNDILSNVADVELHEVSEGVPLLAVGANVHDDDHDHEGEEAHEEEMHEGDDDHADEAEEHADDDHDHEGEEEHDHAEDEHGEGCVMEEEHEHEEEEEEGEHVHAEGTCDPHVWMNPYNVSIWAWNIADVLSELDPANAETYQANAQAYEAQLEELDEEIETILLVVPEENRILVTSHDFMGYFADRYGFETLAVNLSSSLAERDPQALAALIEDIETANVPAIFTEYSAGDQLTRTVSETSGVRAIIPLISGALTAPDGIAPTYIEMMFANATSIAEGLGEIEE